MSFAVHFFVRRSERETKSFLPIWFEFPECNVASFPTTGSSRAGAMQATMKTRQCSRLVDEWVALAGLDPAAYGTHSMRHTEVALV